MYTYIHIHIYIYIYTYISLCASRRFACGGDMSYGICKLQFSPDVWSCTTRVTVSYISSYQIRTSIPNRNAAHDMTRQT